MPAQPIRYIKQTSPQFYKYPGEFNKQDYNTLIDSCGLVDLAYCQPYRVGDPLCFQFKAQEDGANLFADQLILSGTNTSVSAGTLQDSSEDFSAALGLSIGHIVMNDTTGDGSFNTANFTTSVNLNADIFTATPEDYSIYYWKSVGDWTINDGLICADNTGSELFFEEGFTVGTFYRVTFSIENYQFGSLEVYLGDQVSGQLIGIVSANGTYTFYGECLSQGRITFVAPSGEQFTGCINSGNIEAYEMITDYTLVFTDIDGTTLSFESISYTGVGIETGNIIHCTEFPDEGCYRLGILQYGTCPFGATLITNGGFDSTSNWTINAPVGVVTISGGALNFISAETSDGVIQSPTRCVIVEDGNYSVSVTITDYVSGSVTITVGGTSYPPISANGTYNFIINTGGIVDQAVRITASGLVTTLKVTSISVTNANDSILDGLSECFNVGDHDCTEFLKWRNTVNAFGMNYDDPAYFNYMRLYARLQNGRMRDLQYIVNKNAIGIYGTTFSNQIRVEELSLWPVPEYIHLTLAQATAHQEFYIDDVRYAKVSEAIPDYGTTTELARVVVEVARHDQTDQINSY